MIFFMSVSVRSDERDREREEAQAVASDQVLSQQTPAVSMFLTGLDHSVCAWHVP